MSDIIYQLPTKEEMEQYYEALKIFLQLKGKCPLCKKGILQKKRLDNGNLRMECSNCHYVLEIKPPKYVNLLNFFENKKNIIHKDRYQLYLYYIQSIYFNSKKNENKKKLVKENYEILQKKIQEDKKILEMIDKNLKRQNNHLQKLEKEINDLSLLLHSTGLIRNEFYSKISNKKILRIKKQELIQIYSKEYPLTKNRIQFLSENMKIPSKDIELWMDWFQSIISYKKNEILLENIHKEHKNILNTLKKEDLFFPIEAPKVSEKRGTIDSSLLSFMLHGNQSLPDHEKESIRQIKMQTGKSKKIREKEEEKEEIKEEEPPVKTISIPKSMGGKKILNNWLHNNQLSIPTQKKQLKKKKY